MFPEGSFLQLVSQPVTTPKRSCLSSIPQLESSVGTYVLGRTKGTKSKEEEGCEKGVVFKMGRRDGNASRYRGRWVMAVGVVVVSSCGCCLGFGGHVLVSKPALPENYEDLGLV